MLAAVFVLGLGGAVLASLLVHALGWWLGVIAFAILAGLLLCPGWPAHRLYRTLGLDAGTCAPAVPATVR